MRRGLEIIDEGGIKYIRSPHLLKLGARHAFTTRYKHQDMGFKSGADPKTIVKSRKQLCDTIGLDFARLTAARQTHSGEAVAIESQDAGKGAADPADAIPNADGMATNVPGASLMILTADCLPALLFDPAGPVGAFHAGWRGALLGIAESTVRLMFERYGSNPKEMTAVLGPAIQPCCFEVGWDVAAKFAESSAENADAVVESRDGHFFVDLPVFVANSLRRMGLLAENIISSGLCTHCREDIFYSYRRDGRLIGSLGAIIGTRG
ncbi:peptidoglycan editing factor PgeF [bacterium]|nr:peptidoglycan editing factor PgeF [bacterium]